MQESDEEEILSKDTEVLPDKYTKQQRKDIFTMEVKVKIYTLYQLCKIIDLAIKRGAFKANEVSFVGTFYDILSKCIKDACSKFDSKHD